jgi:hypothetical protein
MKPILSTLIILFFISCAPYKFTKLKLKNGQTADVLGKAKDDYFIFKETANSKPKTIHASKIEYLKMKNNLSDFSKFRYLKVRSTGKYLLMEEAIEGSVSLFIITSRFHHANPFGAGMVTMPSSIIVNHYMKRNEDDEVVFLSSTHFANSNLKSVGLEFFKDCPKLVEKIENKEFKKSQVEDVVKYYNSNCSIK